MASKGFLKVQCFKGNDYYPVSKTKVTVTPSGDSTNAKTMDIFTDASGLTEVIDLEAPPIANSQSPGNVPYSLVDLQIDRPGYLPLLIKGVQIYPDRTALQQCNLKYQGETRDTDSGIIDIAPNVQVGNYPSKIPEDPDKALPPPPLGTVVLPKPVVPELVVVHAAGPNAPGPNYTVPFKDYIKNVASCEIYSTWSENTIRANVNCIISFTLNRIYTEWYRGKGKSFDITNSTAYDHAFNYGRNIYDNISVVVDDIFSTYVRRIGKKQPLLTQYCDGNNVKCPGWLTQWGSKYLGDEGKQPFEILKNFYGSDIEYTQAEKVEGIPKSYPGYTLTIGSKGIPVKTIQTYLNEISKAYPLIPKNIVDGNYTDKTAESVRVFQGVFNLPKTGQVDYATWYKISDIYVGVSKIAELRESIEGKERIFYPPTIGDRAINIPYVPYYDDQI
ncbi:Putative peptidoglycan binding domain-containing protein [Clostridium cavendishii DSM 21758]|uniref:Putative peptidoglycan binding domain-containing protein n=1 Tax=Clostridium cavendishii DSM 21758 TaxID=1121302 RepID=A0A1M6PJ31_9CLOT|nr:peptidoglycan-binding domain-containing protein [Clostridium cavendishii]SHK07965.1 Putative peptidoglycan binding domain-containing protein [Clostridium cavendishii DSM 21758]